MPSFQDSCDHYSALNFQSYEPFNMVKVKNPYDYNKPYSLYV